VTREPIVPQLGAHLVVVGAGGTIGSHFVAQLVRIDGVARVTLIDRDRYAAHNVRNQVIAPSAIGRPKAQVQAAEARRLNPRLDVRALTADVERIPLGVLRADLIVSCVDGRRPRQFLNEWARRFGVPWVDAGVHADGQLARVESFGTAADAPCLECRFTAADYRALAQVYPCRGVPEEAPSRSASALGALAAALLALEVSRILTGDDGRLAPGDQVVAAASRYAMWRTAHWSRPDCRLNHGSWPVAARRVPPAVRHLGALLDWTASDAVVQTAGIAGARVVRAFDCPRCRSVRAELRLDRGAHIDGSAVKCGTCGVPMTAVGFETVDDFAPDQLTTPQRKTALRALGLRSHDVLVVRGDTGTAGIELLFGVET
jgi:molybdopterin/thiamine biosynthesis adenylyltransferase